MDLENEKPLTASEIAKLRNLLGLLDNLKVLSGVAPSTKTRLIGAELRNKLGLPYDPESLLLVLNEHNVRTNGRFPLVVSKRIFNPLKNAGLIEVITLVQKSEWEMLRIKNFGRKGLNELKEMFEAMGLKFEMILPDEVLDWCYRRI